MTAGSPASGSAAEVFWVFLRLGLTSFGGPVAHLGYFREVLVLRRRWLSDAAYAEVVAICQLLPGPASSQVGMALGLMRAGPLGALGAWLGFTLPSALLLTLFALLVQQQAASGTTPDWHGLKLVAVAVVAQALWGMGRTLCPDGPRRLIALVAAAAMLLAPGVSTQLAVIAVAGLAGLLLRAHGDPPAAVALYLPLRRQAGQVLVTLYLLLLIGLPLLAAVGGGALAVVDGFYRAGALVFGGGHVVLPLLQAEMVTPGAITEADFVAGYGAAQGIPGPLFAFAAYLGSLSTVGPGGVLGAVLALLAIFLPGALLVLGVLPLWAELRQGHALRRAVPGVNAAVVGLLLAAFVDPVWVSAVGDGADLLLALLALLLLTVGRLPSWCVVLMFALPTVLPIRY